MNTEKRTPAPTRAASELERSFYRADAALTPSSLDDLIEIVADAQSAGRTIIPCGTGTRAYLGRAPSDRVTLVSTAAMREVAQYRPDDFTLGVEAGVPLAEVKAMLEENRQEIPVDTDWTSGTVGGWVGSNDAGPRARSCGTLRNFVIGMEGLRGGDPPSSFRSGGMVVKNVAGYDVAKFLIGSLGTAGIVLRINFKLRAIPPARRLWVAPCAELASASKCAEAIRDARLESAFVTIVDGPASGRLGAAVGAELPLGPLALWSFEGNEDVVAWKGRESERVAREAGAESPLEFDDAARRRAVEFLCRSTRPRVLVQSDLDAEAEGLTTLRVLPTRAPSVSRAAAEIVGRTNELDVAVVDALDGAIHLRWNAGDVRRPLAALRDLTAEERGSGRVTYLPPAFRSEWPSALTENRASAIWAGRLRRAFDPLGVFSADRLLATGAEAAPRSTASTVPGEAKEPGSDGGPSP